MNSAKKYTYPIAFSLSCALSNVLISYIFSKIIDSLGAILGLVFGIIIEFGFSLFIFILVIPVYCFAYIKKIILNEKRKILFLLYNSFVLSMACILMFYQDEKKLIYGIIVFMWSVMWEILFLVYNLLIKK